MVMLIAFSSRPGSMPEAALDVLRLAEREGPADDFCHWAGRIMNANSRQCSSAGRQSFIPRKSASPDWNFKFLRNRLLAQWKSILASNFKVACHPEGSSRRA